MTDPATLEIVKELAQGLRSSRNVNYAHLASFVIVYFDWLLVLESEIKLIWEAKGAPMKALYSLTRYVPILYLPLFQLYRFSDNFTDSQCTTLYKVMSTLFAIPPLCGALIVTIRTWAVWAKAKHMTYLLFGTYIVVSALILILYIISLKYTTHPTIFSGLPFGCIPKYASPYLPAAFVVEAGYDTVILALMLIRGVSLYERGQNSRLFQTLYRDGIIFWVYITAVSIANAALLFTRGNYDVFLLPLQGAIRSVLACRIVVHLRMSASQDINRSEVYSYSGICFGPHASAKTSVGEQTFRDSHRL